MTHNIKAGDRFRATTPDGDTFEGTAESVSEDYVDTEHNRFSALFYDFERLSTPLATEVGALYGPAEGFPGDFIVRVGEPPMGENYSWYTNSHPYSWFSDTKAEELIVKRGWVRRDDRA